jgi:type VI secretion system protein ImpM
VPCGLFGKLPSKRDFVSYNMPRPFLDSWESWLQSAVASSRHALGQGWQDIFLAMPIWRFWCGNEVHGAAVTGALMPSVDGVGRYFPLTLCAVAGDSLRVLPPPSPHLDAWHSQCEHLLLKMLDDHLEAEPAAMLETLASPPMTARQALPQDSGRTLCWSVESGGLDTAFATLVTMNDEMVHANRSYWWTNGGPAHKAQLVVSTGRADSHFLGAMMTGSFG